MNSPLGGELCQKNLERLLPEWHPDCDVESESGGGLGEDGEPRVALQGERLGLAPVVLRQVVGVREILWLAEVAVLIGVVDSDVALVVGGVLRAARGRPLAWSEE